MMSSPPHNPTYTLFHPKYNCDVFERAKGYMLEDTSFMRQSWDYFLKKNPKSHER